MPARTAVGRFSSPLGEFDKKGLSNEREKMRMDCERETSVTYCMKVPTTARDLQIFAALYFVVAGTFKSDPRPLSVVMG